MSSAERRIAALAVFLYTAGVPAAAHDAAVRPSRCTVLEAWMVHEDCLAHGGHDCTRGPAPP